MCVVLGVGGFFLGQTPSLDIAARSATSEGDRKGREGHRD
ncbi:hypothetical protein GL4_2343 [Methyloceanibacter caenitepidi]|uniref:Uncharacterized protein n=1 Tax=Methyloceanibacter caenitepidi TaxID=1384459 RepID=A0A0A8K4D7_9HYPH|nr:hypothetical protein GL4_2343 [Methyloceanibacter caenitepidi]